MTAAYVALGANLGDRVATLESAVRALRQLGDITAVSPVYETDPVGYADQPPYLNSVVALSTHRPAHEVLATLMAIERQHGRERSFPNAPRTLDLDLLLYGEEIVRTERLVVPHPRMQERAFVLVPLSDIAPLVVVPGIDLSVTELLARLESRSGVRLFSPPLSLDQL